MTEDRTLPKFSSAGFLILEPPDGFTNRSKYRRSFGPYHGVDRQPLLLGSCAFPSEATTKGPNDRELTAVVDAWLGSRFGNTAFIPTSAQASLLIRAFRSFGLEFELAYCHLALSPGDEVRASEYPAVVAAPASFERTFGYDVSWPLCNHSAIFQPGVVPESLNWRAKLNAYGLLDQFQDAVRLRAEYLKVYPYPPFDIYLAHKVRPELYGGVIGQNAENVTSIDSDDNP